MLVDDLDSSVLSDADYNVWIQKAYKQLWSKLTRSGIYPNIDTHAIESTANTTQYDLAADHYAIIAVHSDRGSGDWVPVTPMHIQDWPKYDTSREASYATRYLMHSLPSDSDQIRLFPKHSAGKDYRVIYVPNCPTLSTDTDTIDGVAGWEEFIYLDVAIRARIKEQSEVGDLVNERAKIEQEIDELKTERILESLMSPEGPTYYDNILALDPATRSWRR